MSIKTTELQKVINKAKNKQDGVYCTSQIYFKVQDHAVTHVGYFNEIFAVCGNFLTSLGKCPPNELRKTLKNL